MPAVDGDLIKDQPAFFLVFRLNPVDYQDKADYQRILEEHDKDGLKADSAFQEYVLNHLGEQGWELVGFERRPGQVNYYLKRPLSAD